MGDGVVGGDLDSAAVRLGGGGEVTPAALAGISGGKGGRLMSVETDVRSAVSTLLNASLLPIDWLAAHI
jgi:hypothetical protein